MTVPPPHVLGLSPADVAEMPLEQLPALLTALASLQTAVAAQLAAAPSRNAGPPAGADGLVSAIEAAKRTGMSRRWLYLHARKGDLPFARRIGRATRFSPAGIDRWLATRKS